MIVLLDRLVDLRDGGQIGHNLTIDQGCEFIQGKFVLGISHGDMQAGSRFPKDNEFITASHRKRDMTHNTGFDNKIFQRNVGNLNMTRKKF